MITKRRKPVKPSRPYSMKRRKNPAPEEITFDFAAREEYLTGFHKRKLQRIKYAKEEAAKKERKERIEERKSRREEWKADLAKQVEAVNAALRVEGNDQQGTEEGEEGSGESGDESGGEAWKGFEEQETIDHEEEYIDEGKHTTVTVEAVEITRNGFETVPSAKDENEDEEEGEGGKGSEGKGEDREGQGKRKWTKEKPKTPKKKKKKFRYESKAERKVTRMKETAGRRARAQARKDREL